jgi:hypothetical protein
VSAPGLTNARLTLLGEVDPFGKEPHQISAQKHQSPGFGEDLAGFTFVHVCILLSGYDGTGWQLACRPRQDVSVNRTSATRTEGDATLQRRRD